MIIVIYLIFENMKLNAFRLLILFFVLLSGCANPGVSRRMELTGYCGCGKCCGWERGRWRYLKLNFWNRYVNAGKNKGRTYTGLTAGGTKPHEPRPGLLSLDSLIHPWMIPVRIVFFPWFFKSKDGTLAADTQFYTFGTRFYIPGYGYGVVEDRGSAIKGRNRLDLYFSSHQKALKWGRKKVDVRIFNLK